MKVLVCGSRTFNDYDLLEDTLKQWNINELIHGDARGADTLAGDYARTHKLPCTVYQAEWDLHGKSAGPIRNIRMLREGQPELVVAFISPSSVGTKHMVEIAQKAGIETYIVNIGE